MKQEQDMKGLARGAGEHPVCKQGSAGAAKSISEVLLKLKAKVRPWMGANVWGTGQEGTEGKQ